MHFTRKYAPVFFARDVEVRTVLDRMRLPEGRFILISGNSGVGKSSIVDAGVLPTLERSPLSGTSSCLCVRMVPSQGRSPFSALMNALHPYATRGGLQPESIEKDLIISPSRLSCHIQMILKGIEHDGLVLFLDQMEELFTAHDPGQSKAFLTALVHAAQERSLWVLATIRSDHLQYCHDHPDLLEILSGLGHYPVGPTKPYMLPDLIIQPARSAGLTLTEGLARRIIHDMGAEQAHLPVLAFVLNELFDKRSNHKLSEAAYEQLNGIKGAIEHHAARVERTLVEKHGIIMSAMLGRVFQSLVALSADGVPTRRRPLYAAFPLDEVALIDVLVRERLLTTEGDGTSATVSITMKRCLRRGPRLKPISQSIASN
jgi:hypothetical protein